MSVLRSRWLGAAFLLRTAVYGSEADCYGVIWMVAESDRWAGGQGVAGSNPVVPTSIIAGRRPFPRVAEAALTISGLGASGSPLGALVLPTRRRVNGARFVRHPIR
jgi:hypothetical protein